MGGQDLEFRIKTFADLHAAEQAEQRFKNVNKTLKEQGKESALVNQKLKDLETALASDTAQALKLAEAFNQVAASERKAGHDAGAYIKARNDALKNAGVGAPGRLGEAAMAFRGAGGGLAGISAAASAFGPQALAATAAGIVIYKTATKALHEYAESEESVFKMDAALAQAGLLGLDGYRERLQKLASQLQSTTAISDEAWQDVITRLTQFGATPDNIEKNVEAVKDLAGIMGGDLQSAAMAVSKALAGEFEMFGRLGIRIDEHLSQGEKMKQLYHELRRGHGMLEASGESLKGQLQNLKNQFSDLLEAVGPHFLKYSMMREQVDGLATAFKYWAEKIGMTIPPSSLLENQLKKTSAAMLEGKQAAAKYADELKRVKENSDEADDGLNKYLQDLQKQTQLAQDESGAKGELDIAEIKRKEKEGKLTPAQSQLAQSQVTERVEAERIGREKDLRDKSIEKLKGQAASNIEQMQLADRRVDFEKAKLKQFEEHDKKAEQIAKKYDHEINRAEGAGDTESAGKLRTAKQKALTKHANDGGGGDVTAQAQVVKDTKEIAGNLIKDLFPRTMDYERQRNSLEQEAAPKQRIYELQARKRQVDSGVEIDTAQRQGPTGPAQAGGQFVSDDAFRRGLQGGGRGLGNVEQNLKAAHDYWGAVASSLSHVENMTAAQAVQMEAALKRVRDTERKMAILESQIRNGRP